MQLFLDTEFLPRAYEHPVLLSIGLCTLGDQQFYAEHDICVEGCDNDFVVAKVLPQLGRGLGLRGSSSEVGNALVCWLGQFDGQALEVCYDYHADRELFEWLLHHATPRSTMRFEAVHLGYLLQDPAGVQAAEACWKDLFRSRAIGRHHALGDALALRARFAAVHPDPLAEHPYHGARSP